MLTVSVCFFLGFFMYFESVVAEEVLLLINNQYDPRCMMKTWPTLKVNELFKLSVDTEHSNLYFDRCYYPQSDKTIKMSNFVKSTLHYTFTDLWFTMRSKYAWIASQEDVTLNRDHQTYSKPQSSIFLTLNPCDCSYVHKHLECTSPTEACLPMNIKATIDMRETWRCIFYISVSWYSQRKVVYCDIKLNIIKNPDMGAITVNGVNVKFKNENFVYYDFYDGDQVKICCTSTDSEAYYLQLSYTTQAESITTRKRLYGPVEMYIKLTTEYNGASIDCHISDAKNKSVFQIKKMYLRLKESQANLGFQVNGLNLTVKSQNSSKNISYYYYEYYDGEKILITTYKDEMKYDHIDCCIIGTVIPIELNAFKSSPPWRNSSIHVATVLHKGNKEMSLICVVYIKRIYGDMSLRSQDSTSIILTLTPVIVDKYFYVAGLSMANILVKYLNESYSNVIFYEYNDNEKLNLTCYSLHSGIEWIYNTSEINKIGEYNSKLVYDTVLSQYIDVLSGNFILNDNQTNSMITCKAPRSQKVNGNADAFKYTHVKLLRKENFDLITGGKSLNTKFILLASTAATVIVIVVICILICLRYRKRTKRNPNIILINSQHHTERHREGGPVSIQWSEYAAPLDCNASEIYNEPYIPKSVLDLYSKPVPKNLRKKETEPSYAEISLSKTDDELTYSTIEELNSPRQSDDNNTILKDDKNYAQVILPKVENQTVEKTSESEIVCTLTDSYANCTNETNVTEKYVHVIDNELYSNIISNDDYADPAY